MRKIFSLGILFATLSLSAQFEMHDPVNWTSRQTEIGNGQYEIVFTAAIEKPWHIYAMEQEQSGPVPTSFSFDLPKGVNLIGKVQELTKPIIKFDEGFKFNIGAYYKRAEFRQNLKVISPDPISLTAKVEYQCCDDETCLPPFTKEFILSFSGSQTTDVPSSLEEKAVIKGIDKPNRAGVIDSLEGLEEVVEIPQTSENQLEIAESEPEEGRSMTGFLILTFLLGLAAILTPCVYPMIPMTISFFMRGAENRGLAILKGLVFGFAMILVYTGLGVLVALTGLDANFGNILSTHWIPNLIFFLLFMIFAASFLGMFEIILPSGIVNKVDKQADKGGLIGPFFMGITTVLVSFSCTGPIVGSLLAEAAGGEVMKPVLGMFFFSLAFALPFTLLAIFPSMIKNMPKSGGWLNTIKVILGFMMLAFGMKFLSAIDQSYHLDLISREVYLSIWFVIALVLGLYLIGIIRLPNDSKMEFVKVPRLLFAMASFVFAMYLLTGIFGAELRAISSMVPPAKSTIFTSGSGNAEAIQMDNSATFCGPGRYDELFELKYGLKGYFNYEDGLRCAQELNKPIFLDFTGHSCSNCKQMEAQVWSDPEVLRRLREDYIIISLYTDDKTRLPEDEWEITDEGKVLKSIGEINVNFELENFGTFATPWYVLLDNEGNLLSPPIGKELDIEKFIAFLDGGKQK